MMRQAIHELTHLNSSKQRVSIHKAHDRDNLEKLSPDVRLILEQRGLVTSSGEKVNFCGVLLIGGQIYSFFPRKTALSTGVSDITLLLSTIRKYHTLSSTSLTTDDDGAEMIGIERLSLITALLEDYNHNGIYSERRSYRTTSSGKPDWPRTINRQRPFSSGDNLVYLNYESHKHRYNTDSEISKIHSYIIKTLDKSYGQLLFGKTRFNENGVLLPMAVDEGYLLNTLRKALSRVYSDRDIWLLRSLVELILKTHGSLSTEDVIGIKHFHTVWEYMLSRVIPGELSLNSRLPIPTYKTTSGNFIDCPQKGQRTDMIISDASKSKIAIIDAKYYDASNIFGAPGWPDLVKQFFYAKAVKSIFPTASIRNFFIFPGTLPALQSVHMRSREDSSFLDSDYGVIECTYLCPAKVMDAFSKNRKLYDLETVFLQ